MHPGSGSYHSGMAQGSVSQFGKGPLPQAASTDANTAKSKTISKADTIRPPRSASHHHPPSP